MKTRDLKSAIYGLAVGDAMGVPYENNKRGTFTCNGKMIGYLNHNKPAGTWSDDTAMTIATCNSIKEKNRVDINDIKMRFKHWYKYGTYACDGHTFGIGRTTRQALETDIPQTKRSSNGNGSLMRIAPLAFVAEYMLNTEWDETIKNVSAITHAHYISCNACISYVHLLNDIVHGEIEKSGVTHADYIISLFPEIHLRDIDTPPNSTYVIDTFIAALYSFIKTDNYRDCIIKAIELGGDTDTIAAVAGALAGTYYGYDDIPKEWIRNLRNKDKIDKCLFNTYINLGETND